MTTDKIICHYNHVPLNLTPILSLCHIIKTFELALKHFRPIWFLGCTKYSMWKKLDDRMHETNICDNLIFIMQWHIYPIVTKRNFFVCIAALSFSIFRIANSGESSLGITVGFTGDNFIQLYVHLDNYAN
jgi:hypothetical protein